MGNRGEARARSGFAMTEKLTTALSLGGQLGARLFTALGILMEVQKTRFNSPSAVEHRNELRKAGSELGEALKDWKKFVEVLSSVGDKLNFAPSELGVISRVNRLLLDSVERLGGQGGRLVLLIFIALWKATYVVLRSAIQVCRFGLHCIFGFVAERRRSCWWPRCEVRLCLADR